MNHGQEHNTILTRTFKQITDAQRHTIQTLYCKGFSVKHIAYILGCHRSTIYRELKRGQVTHLHSDLSEFITYSADRAIDQAQLNESNKGPKLKIGGHHLLNKCLADLMSKGKASPYAALVKCQQNFTEEKDLAHLPCVKTIYNYIHTYGFPIKPEAMIHKQRKRKSSPNLRRGGHKSRLGMSIETREKIVNERAEIGHHEMDLVVGPLGTKDCLLVLTERKTRIEHIIKLPDKTQQSVRAGLNKIEQYYGKDFKTLFKTITCDNGSEFLDPDLITRSRWGNAQRCKIYYAHPYCSSERGSNENANRLIRRFIPKGKPMKEIKQEDVDEIANWMNNYPRKMFSGQCSSDLDKRFTFHSNVS